ncbi:acetamidase/formamidase family protein [Azospirillum sp. SYSU D00513]|uniref:acetamidase/formamidase family protein n=1 Tax=Azospirillum sp. SYSU D00513 TaxID=2812561 RepID=UPI001A975EAA|nr:acetamidase/formamidase family protein [Azospirillum sp. SYSU D00513]
MPLDIAPGPETVHWGFFDGTLSPVAEIGSGDIVTVHTISGGPEALPPDGSGMTVRPEHRHVHAMVEPGPGPHIMTGPIAVRGAEPGDALRVEILEVSLREDWGFNLIRPGAGALPDLVPEGGHIHLPIDRARGAIRLPWGLEISARPFFGVMGTAPPPGDGRLTSIVPGRFGGNIDNKELTAGSVLFLPVWREGALFSVGDGHAAQGDGEVCLTAVETGLTGRFRIELIKGAGLGAPRAETPEHFITMGFDPDLDEAARIALRDLIALITERTGLSVENAYRLCSLAADLRVTQLVNRHKGIHAMIGRALLGP